MAEEKKNGRLNKYHDMFEDGSTTSDKTSFSESSRRLDPPKTTAKPELKPKPKLPKPKLPKKILPRVDDHGQERTREIPAGQEGESPFLQSASLKPSPVLPNSLPVQSQEDSDSPKLRRTLEQLQDDVSSISERVHKLEVKGQDVAMPKAIQHETPSATMTTQPPGKQLPQFTSVDTQLSHTLTEVSKTMVRMQETQMSMQETQMSMQETQKGMQKEIQGHSEAIKTLTDKVASCERSISEHDDVIGDLKDKVEKMSVSMQSSPDDVQKLHLSEQESTKTQSCAADQLLKKTGQPETMLHEAAVIHRPSNDHSNKQEVESNAKGSKNSEEDGVSNLYREKQNNVVKLVIRLEGSSVSKDLHQPELQVEPTVTRNVQEGESESIKRISCEETGKDKGELICAQK